MRHRPTKLPRRRDASAQLARPTHVYAVGLGMSEHAISLRNDSVSESRFLCRTRCRAGAALSLLLLAFSCGRSEHAEIAGAMRPGPTAAVVVKQAGSPTIERPVRPGHTVDPCARDLRNTRAFEYHIPIDSVTGPIRKLFRRPAVAAKTVVCLDHDAKVTSTHFLKY